MGICFLTDFIESRSHFLQLWLFCVCGVDLVGYETDYAPTEGVIGLRP